MTDDPDIKRMNQLYAEHVAEIKAEAARERCAECAGVSWKGFIIAMILSALVWAVIAAILFYPQAFEVLTAPFNHDMSKHPEAM